MGSLCDRLEQEAIFGLASISPGERVLDIGCGTGIYTLAASQRGAWVIGLDASTEMVRAARKKLQSAGRPPRLVVASAESLPFRAERFDLIIGVTSLCFVARPEDALSQAWRVLKPGGCLVLGELNRHSPWAWFRRIKGLFTETIYSKAHFWGPQELVELLSRQGYQVGQTRTLIFFPPVNTSWILGTHIFLDRLGKKQWPRFGAFLAVRAVKPE